MNNRFKNLTYITIFSAATFIILLAAIMLGIIDEYNTQILTLAGINTIAAISLNLISGYTGQLSLGHAGFMSVGAYAAAVSSVKLGLPIPVGLIIGGVTAAMAGLIIGIPTLRLKGDYLAIATLGFGEIIRVVMINLEGITGGAAGFKGIPAFAEDYKKIPVAGFCWVFGVFLITILAISNLLKSSHGRAIISIREDEIASDSMGINTSYYKIYAFSISSFFAGLAGGLYAHFFNYLKPEVFGFLRSVDILVYVVLGGMGSLTGSIISAIALTFLFSILSDLAEYRMVIYSLALIIIMIFRPKGLMGDKEFSIVKFFREYKFKDSLKNIRVFKSNKR